MRLAEPLRRLLWVYLLMLLGVTVLALLLGVTKDSLAAPLAFGGIAWFAVAFLAGGFVETYRAPTSQPWLVYTLPDKDKYVLPSDSPEAMKDLEEKLSSQTGPMVLAVLSGFGFFRLSALVYYMPVAGFVVLIGTLAFLCAVLFPRGPRR